LQARDFRLVERALSAGNAKHRGWACVAVERLCGTLHCALIPEFARAARVAQIGLDRAYVDRNFPRLRDAVSTGNSELAAYACRGIGALASETTLLTPEQISQSCDRALAGLRSDDFEDRLNAVNLLGYLMRRLDVTRSRQKDAVDQLLAIVGDRQRSSPLKWDEWKRSPSIRAAKERFQASAIDALLNGSAFISDKAQALRAFHLLTRGLANETLDLPALPSIAALASRLPAAERRTAVQLAIGGVSDKRFWRDVGYGISMLHNYAADALTELAPCLNKDEVQQALKAIDSQRWNRDQSKVFETATSALRKRSEQLK
jgi:hypothetical protein